MRLVDKNNNESSAAAYGYTAVAAPIGGHAAGGLPADLSLAELLLMKLLLVKLLLAKLLLAMMYCWWSCC
jgi:hypothetical protein